MGPKRSVPFVFIVVVAATDADTAAVAVAPIMECTKNFCYLSKFDTYMKIRSKGEERQREREKTTTTNCRGKGKRNFCCSFFKNEKFNKDYVLNRNK